MPNLIDVQKSSYDWFTTEGLKEAFADISPIQDFSGNLSMELHPTSVGCQYPEQEMRVVDGELQVKGDMLFDGYWKDPKATDAAFTEDGWLRTGDLARIDPDGFLYIVGRIKNLIILDNGENVSPEEVEAFYYRSNLIRDCLCSECVINGKPAIQLEVLANPGVSDEDVTKECACCPLYK